MTPSYAEISLEYFQNERQSLQFYVLLVLFTALFHISLETSCVVFRARQPLTVMHSFLFLFFFPKKITVQQCCTEGICTATVMLLHYSKWCGGCFSFAWTSRRLELHHSKIWSWFIWWGWRVLWYLMEEWKHWRVLWVFFLRFFLPVFCPKVSVLPLHE